MNKICKKNNCVNEAIPRGKYCELHKTTRTTRPTRPLERLRTNSLPIEENKDTYDRDLELALKNSLEGVKIKKNQFDEDRKLRLEQENEYQEALRLDTERLLKEKIEIEEIELKRLNILKNNPTEKENYFNIKIKLPNNLNLLKKFKEESSVQDIQDYLDVYFFDNKIKIKNYVLVVNNLTKVKLGSRDKDTLLSSLNMSNNFMMFLENLDS
jgi:hypothetical protein